MLNLYLKYFLIILFVLFTIPLAAKPLDISVQTDTSLLENSYVFLADKPLMLEDVIDQDLFQYYHKPYINTGMLAKTIWIKFELQNKSTKPVEKSLILTSALLEHIALYSEENLKTPRLKGVTHIQKEHHTLFPSYIIKLDPGTTKQYYLEVHSKLTPVDFTLKLDDKKHFFETDQLQQFINILLIGFVFALALYSFYCFFIQKTNPIFITVFIFLLSFVNK